MDKIVENRPISREFCGNFWGKLDQKAIGTERADSVVISGKSIGFALIRSVFLMFF